MLMTLKECTKCKNIRKFLIDSERDKEGVCGECHYPPVK